jgi:hypothetical protein
MTCAGWLLLAFLVARLAFQVAQLLVNVIPAVEGISSRREDLVVSISHYQPG